LVVGGLVARHNNLVLGSLIISPRDGGPAGEGGRWVAGAVEGGKRADTKATREDGDTIVTRADGSSAVLGVTTATVARENLVGIIRAFVVTVGSVVGVAINFRREAAALARFLFVGVGGTFIITVGSVVRVIVGIGFTAATHT
jgi:hypothetical protein